MEIGYEPKSVERVMCARSALTVFPRLQRPLRKLVVSLVWGGDDDQLELFVVQDVVQSGVNGNSNTEPFLEFAPLRLRVSLQGGVQRKEFRESEDEGHMKGETGQASSQDASADGFHFCFCVISDTVRLLAHFS